MRKGWALLCVLCCLLIAVVCWRLAVLNDADEESASVVIEHITAEPTEAVPTPAEPTPSPSPELEQWPILVADGDTLTGSGSSNASSVIRLIPYGDKLYYTGTSGNDAENLAPLNLWQINRDGSERILILDEGTIIKKVYSISGYNYANPSTIVKIDHDRIYFMAYVFPESGDSFAQIYSVGMQGQDMRLEQDLVENDTNPDRNATVVGNNTFRIVNDKIVRIDNSGKEEIVYQNEGAFLRDITAVGDWMFFMERANVNAVESRMCIVNTATQVQHTVLEFQQDLLFAGCMNILGNWLYFTNSDSLLCRMPINGGTVETVSSTPILDYVIYDQTIFYFPAEIVQDDSGTGRSYYTLLRRMDLDGANDIAIDSFDP